MCEIKLKGVIVFLITYETWHLTDHLHFRIKIRKTCPHFLVPFFIRLLLQAPQLMITAYPLYLTRMLLFDGYTFNFISEFCNIFYQYRKRNVKFFSALQVGPSLGMRKSSSLESLQTAIQENQRHPRNEPIYARAHPRKYSLHLLVCSFNSIVNGSYYILYLSFPALKHWLTDDNGPEGIVRGSPQQSSLSHKKPSLLKSFSNMFR